jgi:DNA-directed RNA polymerase specialized sigma24 family protein
MDEREWLTDRFQEQRPHLRAAAYRMLGSVAEAEDALQEAWLGFATRILGASRTCGPG